MNSGSRPAPIGSGSTRVSTRVSRAVSMVGSAVTVISGNFLSGGKGSSGVTGQLGPLGGVGQLDTGGVEEQQAEGDGHEERGGRAGVESRLDLSRLLGVVDQRGERVESGRLERAEKFPDRGV